MALDPPIKIDVVLERVGPNNVVVVRIREPHRDTRRTIDVTCDGSEANRAGSRVGTALTEGRANFLANRRMNKSPADALVATRRRFAASGSLRRL
jgi:hypothetical protein